MSRKSHNLGTLALLLVIGIHALSAPQSVVAQNRKVNLKENLPFEDVLRQAQAEDKYIFLDFGSLTCKPCLYIKNNVLTLDSVADFINPRFVSVDYNSGVEKDRLRKLYQVVGEPVLLILDKHGNLMHRMVGKMEGNELMERFRQGLDTENNLVALKNKYANGQRDQRFVLKYLETLKISRDVDIMNSVLQEYLSGPLERLKQPEYYEVFMRYNEDILSREMIYVFDNRQEFYKLFDKVELDGKINSLYANKSRAYLYGHNPPADDPTFVEMLANAQKTDFPSATDWLVYLVPAQHKYKDWVAMAKEVDKIYDFNIIKGNSGKTFKELMVTQYMMYCDDPNGLQYAARWCDDLKIGADQAKATHLEKSRSQVLQKISRMSKEKPVKVEWIDVNRK